MLFDSIFLDILGQNHIVKLLGLFLSKFVRKLATLRLDDERLTRWWAISLWVVTFVDSCLDSQFVLPSWVLVLDQPSRWWFVFVLWPMAFVSIKVFYGSLHKLLLSKAKIECLEVRSFRHNSINFLFNFNILCSKWLIFNPKVFIPLITEHVWSFGAVLLQTSWKWWTCFLYWGSNRYLKTFLPFRIEQV